MADRSIESHVQNPKERSLLTISKKHRRGVLSEARYLFGFPHPSGGNGWRERHFTARRETMQDTVNYWFGHTSLAS